MANVEEPRKVSENISTSNLDITSLVLIAVLFAAGVVLNLTVGRMLQIPGIRPQFVIASYCLAILLLKSPVSISVVIGLLAGLIITITGSSIPGLNFLTEACGALTIGLFVNSAIGEKAFTPFVGTFCATVVSGLLFAVVGNIIQGAEMATVLVKLPTVFGTAVFNAAVVAALLVPLKSALHK